MRLAKNHRRIFLQELNGLRCILRSAVITIGIAAAVAGTTAADARPLDEVVASGTLIVGVYRDNPPFSYRSDGKLVGIDVDIGRHIAARLGVAPSFMEITADESVDDDLRNAVWKGHYLGGVVADVMVRVPYDRTLGLRNDRVALFAPFSEEVFVLAYDPARVGEEPPLSAFRTAKLGVELATLPDYYTAVVGGGTLRDAVVHFRSAEAAATAMLAGEVAGVMATRSSVEAVLAGKAGLYRLTDVNLSAMGRSRWPVGVAVREDSRDLGYAIDDVIATLLNSGELAQLYKAYGVTLIPPEPL